MSLFYHRSAPELASGNGIVRTLHIAEQRLARPGIGLTSLRAAYFMENWGSSIGQALQSGTLYGFLGPNDRKIPMVATRDIGTIAAYSLMLPTKATRIIELSGPQEYSPDDVAAALAKVSGKAVTAAVAPIGGMVPMLTQFGRATESAAEMAGLTEAINAGRIHFGQPGGQPIAGTTTLEQVFSDTLQAGQK